MGRGRGGVRYHGRDLSRFGLRSQDPSSIQHLAYCTRQAKSSEGFFYKGHMYEFRNLVKHLFPPALATAEQYLDLRIHLFEFQVGVLTIHVRHHQVENNNIYGYSHNPVKMHGLETIIGAKYPVPQTS